MGKYIFCVSLNFHLYDACRTHTVILVRSDGKVTFVESNLEDFEKEIWKTETTQFQMEGIGNDSNCNN